MESWENKIISDKINSLQGLPDGYLPNLSSKWEIIEAGLPQRKREVIPLLIRWSVAAAILTGIFLTAIQLNKNNKRQQGAFMQMPSLHIPIVIQEGQNKVVINPAIAKNNKGQKALKPAPVSTVAVTAKQDKPPVINDELKTNPVIPAIDSVAITTDELAITIPQPEIQKRVKRRTFQKDFNDGLLVIDTGYSKPASSQFSFKLQLHTSSGDEVQSSRHLQLKQVL